MDFFRQTAEVLFFVVDNQTRSTASMVEAAYLAGNFLVIAVGNPTPNMFCNVPFDACSKDVRTEMTPSI
jgi:hypothetical protein